MQILNRINLSFLLLVQIVLLTFFMNIQLVLLLFNRSRTPILLFLNLIFSFIEMDQSGFLKIHTGDCMHKRAVLNPYTGQTIFVPCGRCNACNYSRSVRNELRCYSQESISKYSYFITLTYDSFSIPFYRMSYTSLDSGSSKYLVRYKAVPRPKFYKKGKLVTGLDHSTSFEGSFICDKEYYQSFVVQADLSVSGKYPFLRNTFSYINHQDISLFFKRLRRQTAYYTSSYERIHFYFVGEYSPLSFRAHWHLLLFFESDWLAQNISILVDKCWPFGRTSCSLSRDDATSYTAGYTNSFSFTPFHLLSHRQLRPYSRFSNGFGEFLFKKFQEDIRRGAFLQSTTGVSVQLHGRNVSIYPWRSIYSSCVFRACSIPGATFEDVSRLCFHLSNILRRPGFNPRGKCCPTVIATRVVRYVQLCYLSYQTSQALREDPLSYIFTFLGFRLDRHSYIDSFDLPRLVNSLARLVSDFRKFLYGYGLDDRISDYSRFSYALRNSFAFFQYLARENQFQTYSKLSQLPPGLDYFYWRQTPELLEEFKFSPYYNLLVDYQHKKCYDRVKHRELNDLNRKYIEEHA